MLLDELGRTVSLEENAASVLVELHLRAEGPATRKAAVLAFGFTDASGDEVRPVEPYLASERFGPYVYLHTGDEDTTVVRTGVPVPAGARRLRLGGAGWRSSTPVVLEDLLVHVHRPGQEPAFVDGTGRPLPVPVPDLRLTVPVRPGAVHTLSWATDAPPGSQALLLLAYRDGDGRAVLPPADLPVHPELGAHVRVVAEDGSGSGSRRLEVPPDARSAVLTGAGVRGGPVVLLAPPALSVPARGTTDLPSLVAGLRAVPEGAPVLLLLGGAGPLAGPGTPPGRGHRLALACAAAGWHVVLVPADEPPAEQTGPVAERVVQVGRRRLGAVLDVLLGRRGPHVLVCSALPDVLAVSAVDRCHDAGWRVVLEVCDDHEELARVGASPWYEAALEGRVAARADVVVVTGERLRDRVHAMTGRRDVHVVPDGVPDDLLETARPLRSVEAWQERARGCRVGYAGPLDAASFDHGLVAAAAAALPDVSFELVGPGGPGAAPVAPNVRHLGDLGPEELLVAAGRWRAGILPLPVSRLTLARDPATAYLYAAAGLPCVSVPAGAVAALPGTRLFTDAAGLIDAVRAAVDAAPPTADDLRGTEARLEAATWSARAEAVLDLLEPS